MSSNAAVWDRQRKKWLVDQPEERVRQRLVHYLIHELAFPKGLVQVEQALHQLPHVQGHNVPLRRLDILCYGTGIHPEHSLYPLLLIECKAVRLTARTRQQVVGYNSYVGACYVAVANDNDLQTGYYDPQQGEYVFQSGIPSYTHLIENL